MGNEIKKAVDAEKKKEKQTIENLNKHYLPIVKKEVEKAKLAQKEKQKVQKLEEDIKTIKGKKATMSKEKMNNVINKALSKMEKKQKSKMMKAEKKKLLFPKHIPYKIDL